jgi:hypothetical protein
MSQVKCLGGKNRLCSCVNNAVCTAVNKSTRIHCRHTFGFSFTIRMDKSSIPQAEKEVRCLLKTAGYHKSIGTMYYD